MIAILWLTSVPTFILSALRDWILNPIARYLPSITSPVPRIEECDRIEDGNLNVDLELANSRPQNESAHLQEEIRRLRTEIEHLSVARERAERKRQEYQSLAERQSAELQGVKQYLHKIDDVADSDISNAVMYLNDEIFQASMAIAGEEELWSGNSNQETIEVDNIVKRLQGEAYIGAELVDLLRSIQNARDSPLVSIALQATLSVYAQRLANSWTLTAQRDPTLLEQVYLQIREREPPTVAARWRALSREHVKVALGTHEKGTRIFAELANLISDVLLLCGATGTRQSIAETIQQRFGGNLDELRNLALQFQTMTGERVVSGDFALFSANPGDTFCPDLMTAQTDSLQRQAVPLCETFVLCTTSLGLTKTEGTEGGNGHSVRLQMKTRSPCTVLLNTDTYGWSNDTT